MNWFSRPYPLIEKLQTKLYVVLGFGIFIPLFLYTYQPFGIAIIKEEYKFFYVLGIGIHIALVLAFNYFLTPKIFTSFFNPEKWTIGREILYLFSSILLSTCSNFIYNSVIGSEISQYKSFIEFFGITLAVGIFPVMIMVFLVERNLSSKNTLRAEEFSKLLPKNKMKDRVLQTLSIQSETSKPVILKVNAKDFIFATSDNNYSTIFYKKEGVLQRKLLRLSFKNLENQLSEYESIIRCHKSYIVNKYRILKIKGNARSLTLQVELYEDMIPVSRSFPKEKLM